MDLISFQLALTASLLTVDLAMLVVIAVYLAEKVTEHGWYRELSARAALAMFVYFVGVTVIRVWGIGRLYVAKHDRVPNDLLTGSYPVAAGGALVAVVGAICMVRIFSPLSWRWYGWASATVATVASAIAGYFA